MEMFLSVQQSWLVWTCLVKGGKGEKKMKSSYFSQLLNCFILFYTTHTIFFSLPAVGNSTFRTSRKKQVKETDRPVMLYNHHSIMFFFSFRNSNELLREKCSHCPLEKAFYSLKHSWEL